VPRITRTDGQISIRDSPTPSWALGGFLLAGGLVVAMSLCLATNAGDLEPWERLASFAVVAAACGLPTPEIGSGVARGA
jgi:hypothetical protein